jgi:hypothetical protein
MPKPDRTPTTNFNVTALVSDGVIRLSGDIVADAIEVNSGENAAVTIADTADWILNAAVNSSTGASGGCWTRLATGGTNQTFSQVVAPTYCIVYAVSKTAADVITYGPVITIKPKG